MADLEVLSAANHKKSRAPIRIMQFGEGNFLRAFIDWMIQTMNDSGSYHGHVVVVQPLEQGRVADLAKQDGLYTLILQGLNEKGEAVRTHQIIDVLDDFVNPYLDYQKFLHYGESKDLEVVISNTTEAGIAFEEKDVAVDMDKVLPLSYPGKLFALLRHRYQVLGPSYGLAIMPCELIDDNGDHLKEVLLKLAGERHESQGFVDYLEKSCHYTSSLVDRIVPGFPRDEFPALCQEFGYVDNSMVKGEYFHLYVLKKEAYCQAKFPVDKVGLHAIYVDDVHPYKKRKVQILNGAHTSLVPVAYLSGFNEVRESLLDPEINKFLVSELNEEIVPTITTKDAKDFASAVLSRFLNPYVHHALMSIALNSISKYKERDLPTVLDDLAAKKDPKHLLFALAALIKFYDGVRIKNGVSEPIALKDTPEYLVDFNGYWDAYRADKDVKALVHKVLSNVSFWGQDLSQVKGMEKEVAGYLSKIEKAPSVYDALKDFNAHE
jgi:tagaturonate reductase